MPIQPQPPLSPAAERVMRDLGINVGRFWVLTYLAKHPDSTTREIAVEADMTLNALGRSIAALVDAGLVEASEGPERRGKLVTYRLNEPKIRAELEDLWGLLLPGEPLPPKSDA